MSQYKYFCATILKRVRARSNSADGLASPSQLKQETVCSCDLFNTSMECAQRTGASVYCQSPAATAPAAPAVLSDPPRVIVAASAEPVPAAGLPAVVVLQHLYNTRRWHFLPCATWPS